jgi:hypothetical protein
MTAASTPGAHPLDHLVLPTRSLDAARTRLHALGFVVAPTGIHPFGTENCCVFLPDGSYLEPLAVGDEGLTSAAIADGNVFVARDRLYRASRGDEGFSAVVLGTADADADHARFVAAGLSAGETLSFSRAFTDPAGKSDIASFKLAFGAAPDATDAFLFCCQRINAPNVDRGALLAHPNGASGIVEVVAVAERPAEQRRLIGMAANCDADASQNPIKLPNAKLSVVDPGSLTRRFGIPAGSPTELRFAAVVFSVRSAQLASSVLATNAVHYDIAGNDIVVQPASGQGAAFIFQEIQ